MYPIYKFELTADETTQRAYPIYKDGLSKDFEKESGQQFFRAKLSGELTFESEDYKFIAQQAFDERFGLEIFISYNAGASWASYWKGTFWKTDCKFDDDAETVTVKPTVSDVYTDVLAGLDKEFNLIDLAPEIVHVKADKRPMIQVYVPGQTVIGCFLSGMWWEQECDAESNETHLTQTGDGKLNFSLNKTLLRADVSGTATPTLPDLLTGTITGAKFNLLQQGQQDFNNGTYILRYYWNGQQLQQWSIVRASDSVVLWQSAGGGQLVTELPITVSLSPVSGTGASGTVTLDISQTSVYSRYVCDTQAVGNVPTYEIGNDDIVPDNRNYRRVIGYYFPDTIYFSTRLTETPTKWGLYQPNKYYQPPYFIGEPEFFPVARNAWNRVSLWFTFASFDWLVEQSGREQFTIRHAYPLWAVIRALLGEIAPSLDFRANSNYSEFLYPYSDNPISGLDFRLFIVPKSNIVTSGYDQPAQNAPITLRAVLEMLRDCFRCYWFVDENDRFRIEHIQYFRNGGSYSGTPSVGIDLTAQTVSRNGKPWAFGRDQYEYDKPDMASRYQFGWMDDVTQLFNGYPIDILSRYVNPESIEEINVSQFTSDIDYILLNPSAVSKDGFVLLSAVPQNGEYILPYYNFVVDGNDHYLQNAYVAFCMLQDYYAYDMPAPDYEINGVQKVASGVKRLRVQSIKFPTPNDPDLLQLVKTNLGNGTIEKISVNLSSRNANATLRYDTE